REHQRHQGAIANQHHDADRAKRELKPPEEREQRDDGLRCRGRECVQRNAVGPARRLVAVEERAEADAELGQHHQAEEPEREFVAAIAVVGAWREKLVEDHFLYTTGASVFWSITTSDRKSTRLNSSHRTISYAVFCLKKKST